MVGELKQYLFSVLDYTVHQLNELQKTPSTYESRDREVLNLQTLIASFRQQLNTPNNPVSLNAPPIVNDPEVIKIYDYLQEVCVYLDTQLRQQSKQLNSVEQDQLNFLSQLSYIHNSCKRVPQVSPILPVFPVDEEIIESNASEEGQNISSRRKIAVIVANITFYILLIVAVTGFILVGDGGAARVPTEFAGFSVMTVLTSSMEGNNRDSIQQGSLVILRHRDPSDLEVGMVVTYVRDRGTTLTHRIVSIIEDHNGTGERAFRLQGDANVTIDRYVVPADQMLGNIVFSSRSLGVLISFIHHSPLMTVVLIAIYLLTVSTLKNYFKFKREDQLLNSGEAEGNFWEFLKDNLFKKQQGSEFTVETPKKNKKRRIFKLSSTNVIMFILVGVMVFSATQLVSIYFTYRGINQLNDEIRNSFEITRPPVNDADTGTGGEVANGDDDLATHHNRDLRLFDWDGLNARNADVVGWIYVPGTNIDYPILAGASNDTYLHTDIDGNFSIAGSIFLEENNSSDFLDDNTIIYGHNMLSGVKFSAIDAMMRGTITDLDYIYVYTPDGMVFIYRIASVLLTDTSSEIYFLPVLDLAHFYQLMLHNNRWNNVPYDLLNEIYASNDYRRVITLSTCAEAGDSPIRSVAFGILIYELEVH